MTQALSLPHVAGEIVNDGAVRAVRNGRRVRVDILRTDARVAFGVDLVDPDEKAVESAIHVLIDGVGNRPEERQRTEVLARRAFEALHV